MAVPELVGREAELAALDDFLRAPQEHAGCFVLEGPAGIGKTSVWEAAVAIAAADGFRTLVARPSGEEMQLGFTGLADLFDRLDGSVLEELPAPQRRAVESALLLAEHDELTDGRAVAAGTLGVLRALSERGPLLVAIDDVQWLDPASCAALAFAVRRLPGGVRFLLTRRTGEGPPVSALEAAVPPADLGRSAVGPLSFGAPGRLLRRRLDAGLSRPVLRRIHDAAQGNPLFALELGRTVLERGGRLGVADDVPLPESVESVLGERLGGLSPVARRVLLAVELGAGPRLGELAEAGETDGLDEAAAAGVVVVDGDRVRLAHPLFGAVARARSRSADRRGIHEALARVVSDDERRARHLALASGEDAAVAATVAAAAARASKRGAVVAAVELGEQALRLTSSGDPAWGERLLALADYNYTAGELVRVCELVAPVLETLPSGPLKARALVLLADCGESSGTELLDLLERASAAAGSDRRVRAIVDIRTASTLALAFVQRLAESEALASEAAELARGLGDVGLERQALATLMWVRCLRGLSIDEVSGREEALRGGDLPHLYSSANRIRGVRRIWRGELAAARAILVPLLELAEERGEAESYFALRLQLIELEQRAGNWGTSAALLDEWAAQSEEPVGGSAAFARCSALLAAGRGDGGLAQRLAADALGLLQGVEILWHRLEALRAQGIGLLLAGDAAAAIEPLREAWEHMRREGVDDPGAFPVAPELVEALAAQGELDEARGVVERLTALAEAQQHPWGLAAAARCLGLVRLAERADEDAATALEESAERSARLELPFDRARTLVQLGAAYRRLKRKRDGRAALEEAARLFDALGSPGWSERARAELERFGGRPPRGDGLTPTESRVAELVAQGLTNRQVATALVITVGAVERHLTHIYGKLGVRSRTELVRLIAVDAPG